MDERENENNLRQVLEGLEATSEYVMGLAAQRDTFRYLVLQLMLNSGNYDLEITKEDVLSLAGYDLSASYNKDNDTIIVTIEFPEGKNEDLL